MNDRDENISKDERSLEALLAAAFRLDFPEEISDEQAEKFFQQPPRLSEEDEATINSWGTDFIEKLIEEQKTISDKHREDIIISKELEQEYYAMNRDKDGNGIDEETRRKIDEERKKAIEEEEDKENDLNNES